jgi:hypothetical protein
VPGQSKLGKWLIGLTLLTAGIASVALFLPRLVAGNESDDRTIARGGGTTIIHGGTGASGGFVPVLTTIAFHAERTGGGVAGSFDCLALAPEASTGSKSAQFTVNAMYVTGQITGASVHGDTATLTGKANITGLGAGSNVPFTFVAQKGGPGATSVLTVSTLPALPFHEILLQGSFEVADEN